MDINNYYKEVGKRIKSLREKRGESQKELGKILGLTQNAISKLEQGKTALTFENQIRIAEHYNVSHDYLCIGRNSDSMLDLLQKYISLDFLKTTLGIEKMKYPVININKILFDYLLRTAQANNADYMPNDIREIWIEREIELFNESNKTNDFLKIKTFVPVPPKLICPDDKKNTWKQSDLIRELSTYLFDGTQTNNSL